jgi:hypothetical protein
MSISEMAALAERLEEIIRNAITQKRSIESVLRDISSVSDDLYSQVDSYDSQMQKEFQES